MTGASISCVILSCTAKGHDTPPPCSRSCDEAKLKPIKEEQVLVASLAEKLEKWSNCVFSPGSPLRTNRSRNCKMICTSLLILNPPFPPPFASTLVLPPPASEPDGLPHQWRLPESHPVCASHHCSLHSVVGKKQHEGFTLRHSATINTEQIIWSVITLSFLSVCLLSLKEPHRKLLILSTHESTFTPLKTC